MADLPFHAFILWFLAIVIYLFLLFLYILVFPRRKPVQPPVRRPSTASILPQMPTKPRDLNSISVELTKCRALCPPAFIHRYAGKGEDRIFSGIIGGRFPVIIVADGASSRLNTSTGELIEGTGSCAAELAVEVAKKYLTSGLHPDLSSTDVLSCLLGMYDRVAEELQGNPGATTLLVALLYESSEGDTKTPLWCYSYEGDGIINVITPARRIDGWSTYIKLLAPGQKVESTATVSGRGLMVSPVVGCVVYEQEDLIYVASDGMDVVSSWLLKNYNATLQQFILSSLQNSRDTKELNKVLENCPYTDDAVLGIIWTEQRHDRADY